MRHGNLWGGENKNEEVKAVTTFTFMFQEKMRALNVLMFMSKMF